MTFACTFQNLTADLEKYVKTSESDLPEILLSICFNATISRLTVNVVECENIKVSTYAHTDTHTYRQTDRLTASMLKEDYFVTNPIQ